jgi:hypothetical protein
MKRLKGTTVQCALTAMFVLAFARLGHAQIDGKSYSPAFCTMVFNGTTYNNPTHTIIPGTGFSNVSGGSLYAMCPILKDNEYGTAGLAFAEIFIDNPAGSTTSCAIYSVNVFADLVQSPAWVSTSLAGRVGLVLSVPSKSEYWGTYSIMCQLPNRGVIKSYTVQEN